jgi:hypothetical protein
MPSVSALIANVFKHGVVVMKKRDKGWVAIEDVRPVFDRLIAIYGTKAKVAKALGIHKQGFLNPNKKLIQRKTLDRALELLKEHEVNLYQKRTGGSVPLEVVESIKLSEILRAWVVTYLIEHDDDRNHMFEGPTKVIANRAGISERQASAYINNTTPSPWVGVNTADKVLVAIDQHYVLRDGTLPVIANPTLSMEAWVRYMEGRGCI